MHFFHNVTNIWREDVKQHSADHLSSSIYIEMKEGFVAQINFHFNDEQHAALWAAELSKAGIYVGDMTPACVSFAFHHVISTVALEDDNSLRINLLDKDKISNSLHIFRQGETK